MKRILLSLLLLLPVFGFGQIQSTIATTQVRPAAQVYSLTGFNVNYNTTPFSYLSSAAYSDAGSFRTGANVVDVETAAIDGASFSNAIVGAGFVYSYTDPKITCIETITNDLMFFDPVTLVETSRISSVNFSQGLGIDPVNQWLYNMNVSAQIQVVDFAGSAVASLTCPAYTPSNISAFYDYKTDELYVLPHATGTGTLPIQIWRRTAPTVFSLKENTWYFSGDGGARDYVGGSFVNFHGAGNNNVTRIREQTPDGKNGIHVWPGPTANGFTTEGLTVLPNKAFLVSDPSSLHGNVVGGNRLWLLDPRGEWGMYDRSPSMTPFQVGFSGGTITGNFDTQVITQYKGERIYSPVYDTDTYTNTENTSAWTYTFSSGGDADITWVGSNTAPTTSPTTSLYSTLPHYSGWGTTIPSAEQGTPGTFRYKQAVLTVKDATPSTIITPQDILDATHDSTRVFVTTHDAETLYILTDPTAGSTNQITVMINHADINNPLNNATEGQRREYNVAGRYTGSLAANSHQLLANVNSFRYDQTGEITVISRREINTTQAFFFTVAVSNTNGNRLVFGHKASGGSPANEVYIEYWDNTNAVVARVGFVETDTDLHKFTFRSNGSAWEILEDNVSQTLNVSVGSNTGVWFGDLDQINRGAMGFLYGTSTAAGKDRSRLLSIRSGLNNTAQNTLMDSYITQKTLLTP